MKKIIIVLLSIIVLIVIALFVFTRTANRYKNNGDLKLKGLTSPVKVIRDEKGMAYIYAEKLYDAIRAQGFVAAQDRLFQMEVIRLFSQGRICELAGEKSRKLDIRMRTLGFHRNAKLHVPLLGEDTRNFFKAYVEGVNEYISTMKNEYPLEFRLAGISPRPWTIEDSLTIVYYLGWDMAANLHTEMISQMLIEKVGRQKASEIFPLNINPDDETSTTACRQNPVSIAKNLGLFRDSLLMSFFGRGYAAPGIGSNNWTVNGSRSSSGKPILSNDPHMDTGTIPGHFHPVGIITPDIRAVGVIVPGIPGFIIGRNNYVAMGITNSYGDGQDLYIETIDPLNPDNYLEGKRSIPFTVIEETLKIKDTKSKSGFRKETVKIRLTRRGPVVSGILRDFETKYVVSVRWSPYETMGPNLGFEKFITAKSILDLKKALSNVTTGMFNIVFADVYGNIGWHTTSRLPKRSQRDSTIPYTITNTADNWFGWIPFNNMPSSYNPPKGWLGTCNHKTIGKNYPYYISSYFSPSYRYRRLKELIASKKVTTVDDHWNYQRDAKNLMAVELAPIMARALSAHDDTREMGEILSAWDFKESADKSAPTVFQAVFRRFAYLTFIDELGEELCKTFLDVKYYWKERFHSMVTAGNSDWFDITSTSLKETRDDLFHMAALDVKKELGDKFGNNPKKWRWGDIHQREFMSPLRKKGLLKGFFGGGVYPSDGSAETLYRATFPYSTPYTVNSGAGLRMVVDLADDQKVTAVLPGGVCGRVFNPHTTDQIKAFMNGDKLYWWFSDAMIEKHAKHTIILKPGT